MQHAHIRTTWINFSRSRARTHANVCTHKSISKTHRPDEIVSSANALTLHSLLLILLLYLLREVYLYLRPVIFIIDDELSEKRIKNNNSKDCTCKRAPSQPAVEVNDDKHDIETNVQQNNENTHIYGFR